MTTKCPHCVAQLEINVTSQGRTSDGTMQRAVIEAIHPVPVCDGWGGDSQADLVPLAAAAT